MILVGIGIVKVERVEFHYMQYFYIAITVSLVITKWESDTRLVFYSSPCLLTLFILPLSLIVLCVYCLSLIWKETVPSHTHSHFWVYACVHTSDEHRERVFFLIKKREKAD